MVHARLDPTYWRMRVEVFHEVAALDISSPLALALDGGVVVLPTMIAIDFSPRVCRRVAHHRRATLHWQACIWLHLRCMRTVHEPEMVRTPPMECMTVA
jgi:hypothetical protein